MTLGRTAFLHGSEPFLLQQASGQCSMCPLLGSVYGSGEEGVKEEAETSWKDLAGDDSPGWGDPRCQRFSGGTATRGHQSIRGASLLSREWSEPNAHEGSEALAVSWRLEMETSLFLILPGWLLRSRGEIRPPRALLASRCLPASPEFSDKLCHNIDGVIKCHAEQTQVLNDVPVRELLCERQAAPVKQPREVGELLV